MDYSTGLYLQKDPVHYSDPGVVAVQHAIKARDPFLTGLSTLQDHQHFLYYTRGDLVRCVDVTNTTVDDLDMLYRACQPAEFGRGGESVFDESYRRAGEMDPSIFATQFDPRSLGIHEQVSKVLLTDEHGMMDMELYKLNVYGKGDFFKAHKDTPRNKNMVGSLVVVLPTPHEGGQLVLRQDGKEWVIDSADKFAYAQGPSVCYIAFYSDVEHEVLPVSSGYRVTLTYNLYHVSSKSPSSPIITPHYLNLKQALVNLVNDNSVLPTGGYLGFGLVHDYVHTGHNILGLLMDQLKGSDRALLDVCNALGLRCRPHLLYRNLLKDRYESGGLNLITTKELDLPPDETSGIFLDEGTSDIEQLELALAGFATEEAEIVNLVGDPYTSTLVFDPNILPEGSMLPNRCKNPPTQVMEITQMRSSMESKSTYMAYGNEATLDYFYGTACMLVAVEPVTVRKLLAV